MLVSAAVTAFVALAAVATAAAGLGGAGGGGFGLLHPAKRITPPQQGQGRN